VRRGTSMTAGARRQHRAANTSYHEMRISQTDRHTDRQFLTPARAVAADDVTMETYYYGGQ